MKRDACAVANKEADWVRRLQAGDASAFDEVFACHRRGVFAYVRGMVGDWGLAEDIVQECFVRLAGNARTLRPERGVGGWLYRVARNRSLDVLRHRRFEQLPGDEEIDRRRSDEAAGPSESPDAGLVAREDAERVRRALAGLTARERDVLLLRFYGGLTFQEIGRALRRPLGTVLWQGNRSLRKLRKQMGSEDALPA